MKNNLFSILALALTFSIVGCAGSGADLPKPDPNAFTVVPMGSGIALKDGTNKTWTLDEVPTLVNERGSLLVNGREGMAFTLTDQPISTSGRGGGDHKDVVMTFEGEILRISNDSTRGGDPYVYAWVGNSTRSYPIERVNYRNEAARIVRIGFHVSLQDSLDTADISAAQVRYDLGL
jgi:hypothetical protein